MANRSDCGHFRGWDYSEFQWYCRKKSKWVYDLIYPGAKGDLICSFNSINIFRPFGIDSRWATMRHPWYHIDNPKPSLDRFGISGGLYVTQVTAETGGFVAIPKSHRGYRPLEFSSLDSVGAFKNVHPILQESMNNRASDVERPTDPPAPPEEPEVPFSFSGMTLKGADEEAGSESGTHAEASASGQKRDSGCRGKEKEREREEYPVGLNEFVPPSVQDSGYLDICSYKQGMDSEANLRTQNTQHTQPVLVCTRGPGRLILWDPRLVHCSTAAIRVQTPLKQEEHVEMPPPPPPFRPSLLRLLGWISFCPAGWASADVLRERRDLVSRGLGINEATPWVLSSQRRFESPLCGASAWEDQEVQTFISGRKHQN
uniref:Uncharacterized protein n=1 Tax=Chromera velia CCMP2878 TaxID=1169474 RepID=A0A0G4I4N2_9ALVE|eukprot:Cvel_10947.t1-p1 / transcript=Cvel_10947.t1 / gene=Cvel_10947 / organism=Chromera_velia_CCMP2878 / gene_product=hypothetical protein / transcript_product=hypothetical protein / location=Cvel_scaffold673:34033-35836(+) / protein_length=371 / sequence_SO=supercontig / SO=protein_coding / is_pseudo=false